MISYYDEHDRLEFLMPFNENYHEEGQFLMVDSCQGGGIYMDLVESIEKGKLMRFKGKFQEAEAINKNKRMYPYGILDENMGRLQEAIQENGLIGELDHPCVVHKNFEVFTVNGWKPFESIRVGDYVYSRVDGEMVASKVEAIIDQPYDGKAYKVKGQSIDSSFTAPHKFLMCNRSHKEYYSTLEEIHSNRIKHSHSYIPKTANYYGAEVETITLPGVERERLEYASEDIEIDAGKFATFMGLYLAEGCLKHSKKSNRVEICQKTEYGRNIIRELLKDFHKDIEWKECERGFYTADARLHDYLIPLGNLYNKYIPAEIKGWSKDLLEKLIIAFIVGDGRMSRLDENRKSSNRKLAMEAADFTLDAGTYTRMSLFSVSEQLVDDLHECLVKCGKCGVRSVQESKEDYMFAGRLIKVANKKPLHVLSISRSKGIHMDPRFLQTTEIHHTGRIYCLTTEHGNFYMRDKGKAFWTGNCDSIIHFANASHKITKLWWEGNTMMGEGEILNTPHGKVLQELVKGNVRIGMSSRGVGNGKVNEDGILVIGESYKLITFDAVADPSTFKAFQKEIVGNKRESYLPTRNPKTVSKNDNSSIYKVSKEQVLACLGGIVKTQTNEIKRGLK